MCRCIRVDRFYRYQYCNSCLPTWTTITRSRVLFLGQEEYGHMRMPLFHLFGGSTTVGHHGAWRKRPRHCQWYLVMFLHHPCTANPKKRWVESQPCATIHCCKLLYSWGEIVSLQNQKLAAIVPWPCWSCPSCASGFIDQRFLLRCVCRSHLTHMFFVVPKGSNHYNPVCQSLVTI